MGGGGGYKTSLPLKIRDDLSFQECIVTELRFGHKKIFFTVLYRNPFYKSDTLEFMNFITELELLVSKIKLEKPYVMLFAGDFNAHSKSWYADGDTNSGGIQLDTLFSDLGLSQLISEPTHTRENCNPTCIDLILTDQPNLIMETGVRPSLDPSCKHQITFCKLNFKIPPLRPFKIPPLRPFKIPPLRPFKIPPLRPFRIPPLRPFKRPPLRPFRNTPFATF